MNTRKAVRKMTVNIDEGERRNFVLEYFVLEKETYIDSRSHNTYGIEVLKRERTEQGTVRIEYRKIFDIFCTEQEAISACQLLADNTVTPVSVYDIIEQLIGTDEIEYEEYEIMAV